MFWPLNNFGEVTCEPNHQTMPIQLINSGVAAIGAERKVAKRYSLVFIFFADSWLTYFRKQLI